MALLFSYDESASASGFTAIRNAGGIAFAENTGAHQYSQFLEHTNSSLELDKGFSPRNIAQIVAERSHWQLEEDLTESNDQSLAIADAIPQIARILEQETRQDFRHYKQTTLVRRIKRRMQLLKVGEVQNYVKILAKSKEESTTLLHEILVGVTSFFRDREAFNALSEKVLPKLYDSEKSIRIWVPGCSTGQEVYTLAMLVKEYCEKHDENPKIQIFGTDLDERSLQFARKGIFSDESVQQIDKKRLEKWFTRRGKFFHVKPELREICLFSPHNLISDPPFTRVDLISCRNLLIYLGEHLQQKLFPLFHYSLRSGGYLFLGSAESSVAHKELFSQIDVKNRISIRINTNIATPMPATPFPRYGDVGPASSKGEEPDYLQIMHSIVLDEFAPKSALINEDGQILVTSGDMTPWMKVVGGKFQNNVFSLTHKELRTSLRAMVREAMRIKRKCSTRCIYQDTSTAKSLVQIIVQPMPKLGEVKELYLIIFKDAGHSIQVEAFEDATPSPNVEIIEELEAQLFRTRVDLEKTIQDLESANEELKSSNEELVSMNEELQSTNEELETSKEDVQAGNRALSQAKIDLENLLKSTEIATIFLDDESRLRGFTPPSKEIFNLIDSDIGRPLFHQTHNAFDMPDLPNFTLVKKAKRPIEDLVAMKNGRYYNRRVLPYRNGEGSVDGIVVTFIDVTDMRLTEQRFRTLVDVSSQIVWTAEPDGSIIENSPSWLAFTGQSSEDLHGVGWLNALHPDDRERVIEAWQDSVSRRKPLETEYRIHHVDLGYRWTEVRAAPLTKADGSVLSWIGMNTDITERKKIETELETVKQYLETALKENDVGIWHLDIEQDCIVGDLNLYNLFGLPNRKSLPLASFIDKILPEDRPQVEAAIAAVVAKGGVYDEEYRVIHPRIGERWLHARGKVKLDEKGLVASFPGVVVDITQRKRTEQELRENDLRLRVAKDAAGLGVFDYKPLEAVLGWDERMRTIWGFAEAREISYEQAVSAIHPDDRENVQKNVNSALDPAGEGEYRVEYRVVNQKTQTIVWVLATGKVLFENGLPTNFIGFIQDISERKEAERLLTESEAKFRATFNNAAVGIAHVGIDGTWLRVNRKLSDILGYSEKELQSKNFQDLSYPTDFKKEKTQFEQMSRGDIEGYQIEKRYLHKEGNYIWVNHTISLQRDPDGRAVYSILIIEDLSVRKKAEAAVIERDIRINNLLDSTAEGIYGLDTDGLCIFANKACAELLGYPGPEALLGRSVLELVHQDQIDVDESSATSPKIFEAFANHERVHVFDEQMTQKDGNLFWAEYWFHPIEVEGDIKGAVVTFLNISYRKKQEQQLSRAKKSAEAANQSKSEFLANVSHEIRTPMSSILGYTDLLGETLKDKTNQDALKIIRRNGEFLLDMLNDILDLSKIEAGKLEVELEYTDIRKLIDDIKDMMSVRAREKQLDLKVSVADEVPSYIKTDPHRARQILVNLVGNAIKFTDSGEVKIKVSIDNQKDKVQIEVSDTGIGIEKERLNNLFRPFSQVDSSSTRKVGGVGLGLSISRRLAGMLGGNIIPYSELGIGSCFIFTVPIGAQFIPSPVEDAVETLNVSDAVLPPSCQILLVEDNADVRSLTLAMLNSSGASVEVAENGEEAVLKASARKFDVILMDMQMPIKDGYTATKELRVNGNRTPIIAVTAHAMKHEKARCFDAGCTAYLRKPVNKSNLTACINQVLASSVEADRISVLLIEDNQDLRNVFTIMLERQNMQVRSVATPAAAIAAVAAKDPDCILMDLCLGEDHGFELIKDLKPKSRAVFVAMSGHTDEAVKTEATERGFAGYLEKPVKADDMVKMIVTLLSARKDS